MYLNGFHTLLFIEIKDVMHLLYYEVLDYCSTCRHQYFKKYIILKHSVLLVLNVAMSNLYIYIYFTNIEITFTVATVVPPTAC